MYGTVFFRLDLKKIIIEAGYQNLCEVDILHQRDR